MATTEIQTFKQVMRCSDLMGDRVVNRMDEDLGKISDIVLDLPTGRIAYAVLSFGGVLGIGDKLFALPWARLSYDQDRGVFILDVDKETLEKAPGFDKNMWPDMSDQEWGKVVHTHYGTRPYWEPDNPLTGL